MSSRLGDNASATGVWKNLGLRAVGKYLLLPTACAHIQVEQPKTKVKTCSRFRFLPPPLQQTKITEQYTKTKKKTALTPSSTVATAIDKHKTSMVNLYIYILSLRGGASTSYYCTSFTRPYTGRAYSTHDRNVTRAACSAKTFFFDETLDLTYFFSPILP